MLAPGSSLSTIGRMVAAPSTSVSSRPRRLSMRSVKTWPRSRSAPSCTSSMATKATSRSRGMASTVATQNRGFWRLDLLLAGDQGDVLGPDPVGDLVVDLAREQPQRQPDDAGRMREHPLDGEMGLAGVGRAEHCGDASATEAALAGRGRRKRNSHRCPGWSGPRQRCAGLSVPQCANARRFGPVLKLGNDSRTKRARIR